MRRTYPILLLLCIAVHSGAQEKSDLELNGLKGKVARVTELEYGCPKNTFPTSILRAVPFPEYTVKHTTHLLDERGNQVSCNYYNKKNKLIYQAFYHYNMANYRTESIRKDADSNLLSRIVYKYDAKGYPAETDFYNSKDSLYLVVNETEKYFSCKNVYNYDERGKLIKKEGFHEDGTTTIIKPISGQKFIKHDDDRKGNSVREREYDEDSTITSETIYRYDLYDQNGNWHKRTSWSVKDDVEFWKPHLYIVFRDIAYY